MLVYGLGYQKDDGFEQVMFLRNNTERKEKNTKEFFQKRTKMLKNNKKLLTKWTTSDIIKLQKKRKEVNKMATFYTIDMTFTDGITKTVMVTGAEAAYETFEVACNLASISDGIAKVEMCVSKDDDPLEWEVLESEEF